MARREIAASGFEMDDGTAQQNHDIASENPDSQPDPPGKPERQIEGVEHELIGQRIEERTELRFSLHSACGVSIGEVRSAGEQAEDRREMIVVIQDGLNTEWRQDKAGYREEIGESNGGQVNSREHGQHVSPPDRNSGSHKVTGPT